MRQTGSTYIKAITFFVISFFITTAQAQSDALLLIKGKTSLKFRAKGLGLNSGVKAVAWKEEALEGVKIEVKKNDVTIVIVTSENKGKYSFQIPVSITDPKNNYIVYFSKDGIAPQMVNINSYLTKDEFAKYSSGKYDCELNLAMIQTAVKDIEPDKSSAKIKWDNVKEHKFTLDPVYAKTALSEEQKILANPDLYYTSLAKKKKKQEDVLSKNKAAAEAKLKANEETKKKADEEARLKAEADAKKLADLKAKEEADKIQREQEEALKMEKLKKHIADSLAELARKKALEGISAKVEIKKIVKPVEEDKDENKDQYDISEKYSISIARQSLSTEKDKRNKEKGKNLTAKYESFNILTSLLNDVDEYDKKNKK